MRLQRVTSLASTVAFAVAFALACAVALAALPLTTRAQGTANPHGTLSTSCVSCHRADAWKPASISPSFRHAESVFPLDGAHSRTACLACHRSLDFSKAPVACSSCHNDVHNGELGTECARCHTTRGFTDLARMRTAHEATRFPLRGAHASVECISCHAAAQPGHMQFAGRPTTCVACHADSYRTTTSPDHQAAHMSQDCASCHGVGSWSGARYDHSQTGFPLDGAHRAVSCNACHADHVYVGKPTACAACHMTNYNQAAPPHAAAGFPTTCLTCHTTATWTGAPFDHSTTQFPLTGAHATAVCASCHADGVFHGKPTTCISCHQPNYNSALLPPHSALAFSVVCTACHTNVAWQPATYDHSATQFALTGAHLAVSCQGCHADRVYRGKPTTCVSCHQADFNNSVNPPHRSGNFSTTCTLCHSTTAWHGAPFNHATTQFPLTGAHLATACSACHGDGVYQGKSTACASCHQANYAATRNPPHASSGFPTTCQNCHTTTAWLGSPFDHSTTQFPLIGAHKTVACASCHGDGVYHGKPTACASCHMANYTATRTPPHASSGFPTTCETCHTPTAWLGSPFNHSTTAFPLTGAHAAVVCASCHGDGVYHGKSTACISCHQPDYNTALLPPHSSLAFSTVCTTCHTTVGWQPATFNHATTIFPLTGAHLAASCNDCHADKVYKGKPTTCVSCHQAKYTATTNPPHASAGFATTCESCHTTATWAGATFNHATTRFPLTGAHTTVACASCHSDGVYHGKTMVCSGCHMTDYNGTNNPAHAAAGFPTTCEGCHNTTTWLGATFNHDASFFPIYSGAHKGRWSVCADCHTAPTNFAVFVCITCHTKATTDSHHQGKSGYVYDSPHCYSCHPKGRAG